MSVCCKRILVKLSGEALAGHNDKMILDNNKLQVVAKAIKAMADEGVQICVVVGAGNIWRGKLGDEIGIEHSTADYMGMLGTIINSLALQSSFESVGISSRVMSSIEVRAVCEPYIKRKAIRHLEKGRVVIFAGGTGNPFFTTDTTAALRAMEMDCNAIFMAKNGVDGVYDSDPRKNKNAKLLKNLTFSEIMTKKLEVMDTTAVALIQNSNIQIRVFNMDDTANFTKVLHNEDIGSTVTKGE